MYGAGFYMKSFFGGNLAPLGTYFKQQITLLFYTVDPKVPINTYDPFLPVPDFTNRSPYATFAYSIELGQNRIFLNRLFIDYGIRFGFLPTVIYYKNVHATETNYLKVNAINRLFNHYLVNIKLGTGILLF
jgi:hypothetical protein